MPNGKSQAGTKADSEQKDQDMQVSQHSRKPNVICRLICLFLGHKKIKNKCQRCGTQFGVPKMDCPPKPP